MGSPIEIAVAQPRRLSWDLAANADRRAEAVRAAAIAARAAGAGGAPGEAGSARLA